MNFLSPAFLLFLAVVLVLYHLAGGRTRRQGGVWLLLALASSLFYAYHTPLYFPLLPGISYLAYRFALSLSRAGEEGRVRRDRVALFISLLLLPLLFFKYTHFFLRSLGELSLLLFRQPLTHSLPVLALPLGISFFTFQNISYVTDVVRGRFPAERSFLRYYLYISFFPQLVAGPIVAARQFLPQLHRRHFHSLAHLDYRGALFFLLSGALKKGVLADRLAEVADPAFADPAHFSSVSLVLAVVAYSLQIYFDFSGYSDLAVGLGRLFGFSLPENFRFPYSATSFRDFWRRWHITLSVWLRDHIYIPLGGSRLGAARMHLALLATMTLGGLWHGAHVNFLLWGALHSLFMSLERLIPDSLFRRIWFRTLFRGLTLLGVVLLWIPFRTGSEADGFQKMLVIYERLLFFTPGPYAESSLRITLLALLGLMGGSLFYPNIRSFFYNKGPVWLGFAGALSLILVTLLSPSGQGQFIYFVF